MQKTRKFVFWIGLTGMILFTYHAHAVSADMREGINFFDQKNYVEAANHFHKASYRSKDPKEALKAKYYLALALYNLKLYQASSFPLISVASKLETATGKKAFDRLVSISDKLNDQSVLNYSLSKLSVEDLSETGVELFYNRLAESQYNQDDIPAALESLKKSFAQNQNNEETLFLLGLYNLRAGDAKKGVFYFEKLSSLYTDKRVNDPKRGIALINLARAYYQDRQWNEAINTYKQIPKDNKMYRKSLNELTWAMFRKGKLRSALSTVQTLHSPFYENYFEPESLILRSIILLLICQYDELAKSLKSYEQNFFPAYSAISLWNAELRKSDEAYKEIELAQAQLKDPKLMSQYKGKLPFFMVRTLIQEPPLSTKLKYTRQVFLESQLFSKLFRDRKFQTLRKYGQKIYSNRLRYAKREVGDTLNRLVLSREKDLEDFSAQLEFLKYELISGQKITARKKVDETKIAKTDANRERSFYVQNGYRYWPFEGEFWRDEIGNYQYIGVNRCE